MAKRSRDATDACFIMIRKIAFWAIQWGTLGPNIFYNITSLSFNIKKLYRRRLSLNTSVLCAKTAKLRAEQALAGLSVNVRASSIPDGKRVINFLG